MAQIQLEGFVLLWGPPSPRAGVDLKVLDVNQGFTETLDEIRDALLISLGCHLKLDFGEAGKGRSSRKGMVGAGAGMGVVDGSRPKRREVIPSQQSHPDRRLAGNCERRRTPRSAYVRTVCDGECDFIRFELVGDGCEYIAHDGHLELLPDANAPENGDGLQVREQVRGDSVALGGVSVGEVGEEDSEALRATCELLDVRKRLSKFLKDVSRIVG